LRGPSRSWSWRNSCGAQGSRGPWGRLWRQKLCGSRSAGRDRGRLKPNATYFESDGHSAQIILQHSQAFAACDDSVGRALRPAAAPLWSAFGWVRTYLTNHTPADRVEGGVTGQGEARFYGFLGEVRLPSEGPLGPGGSGGPFRSLILSPRPRRRRGPFVCSLASFRTASCSMSADFDAVSTLRNAISKRSAEMPPSGKLIGGGVLMCLHDNAVRAW